MKHNKAVITYMGKQTCVACDRKCNKAWGICSRPSISLSEDDIDDFAYLADKELGDAPINPGTKEGGVSKPMSPDEFPTKWCVRECERCYIGVPGFSLSDPIKLPDYSQRVHNY